MADSVDSAARCTACKRIAAGLSVLVTATRAAMQCTCGRADCASMTFVREAMTLAEGLLQGGSPDPIALERARVLAELKGVLTDESRLEQEFGALVKIGLERGDSALHVTAIAVISLVGRIVDPDFTPAAIEGH